MNHDGHNHDGPDPLMHELTIEPDTELAKILHSTKIESNSYHHQGIKEIGTGLTINAHTDDGIIDGFEDMSAGYVMAIQAHPEALVAKGNEAWLRVFESFITASNDHRYSGLEKSNLEPASHSLR